jgi:hypothetical protein
MNMAKKLESRQRSWSEDKEARVKSLIYFSTSVHSSAYDMHGGCSLSCSLHYRFSNMASSGSAVSVHWLHCWLLQVPLCQSIESIDGFIRFRCVSTLSPLMASSGPAVSVHWVHCVQASLVISHHAWTPFMYWVLRGINIHPP